MPENFTKYLILLIFFTCCIMCYSDEKISSQFSFTTNDISGYGDYYSVKSCLQFTFPVIQNKFFINLGLESDKFEIEPSEISFLLKFNDYINLSFGKIRNGFSLEQYLYEPQKLFSTDSLISNHMINLSYISSNLGLRLFKTYKRNTLPVSYFIHICLIPSQIEVQLNTGFIFHFNGENSYIGISGCYFPFIAHEMWEDENPDYNKHNFLINAFYADYSHNLKYGTEFTFGSNLSAPISLFQYPADSELSYFTGADIHLGYQINFNKLEWTPMIRYSILFPEISLMEIILMEIRLGNLIQFKDHFNIHLDSGIGINTEYFNSKLYTYFNFLWGLKFLVSL